MENKFFPFFFKSDIGSIFFLSFLSGLSFTDTDNSQDCRGRGETFFYSTLPLPPAHEHTDIYVQLCTCDDYRNPCIYQGATRWDLPPY